MLAFAFAVMADPVSSVAYAVEAALRALDGDLALLVPTMGLVVAIIALIIVNYQQLITRYPHGGGASAAAGEAFGEAWAFIPIGALIVDFVLTIAISVSAGASATIAYFPGLAPWRVPLALLLVVVVGGITWFGHLGRLFFALMTLAFIVVAGVVLVFGLGATPHQVGTITQTSGRESLLAVALAFPVAMALATGVEAPSSAIAQLGQLDDVGRRQFGRVTLWLTLGIVGSITVGLAVEAHRLRIGIPHAETTQIAELARVAAPGPVFAAFQLVTALLLLSAASSSFQAGPGLLKALARHENQEGRTIGILARGLGRTNAHHTPYWGVVLFTTISAAVVAAAGARDQELVLFYAVSVFLSFLAGLLAMALFSHRDAHTGSLVLNLGGAVVVAFTLAINLARGVPLVSLGAALLVAAVLFGTWVRAGRPGGIGNLAAQAEGAPPDDGQG
ncbi:amino acid permease [Nocardioides rubriscoriae]|uniref:amino acid permease n=1 Tax=Nocardioides rubriscoriae TaxID=642762 RepID=UPI001478D0EF